MQSRRCSAPFYAKLLLDIGIAIVLAVSLNIVNGFAGQFSLGHAGFMVVGGYARGADHLLRLDQARLDRHRAPYGAMSTAASSAAAMLLFLARVPGRRRRRGARRARRRPAVAAPARRLPRDRHARLRRDRARARAADRRRDRAREGGRRVDGSMLRQTSAGRSASREHADVRVADAVARGRRAADRPRRHLLRRSLFVAILLIAATGSRSSSHGRALLAVRENEIAAEAMGVNTAARQGRRVRDRGVLRRHRRRRCSRTRSAPR